MDTLVERLLGHYPIGPVVNGVPELGWRDMTGVELKGATLPLPIHLEAANAIMELQDEITRLKGLLVEKGTCSYHPPTHTETPA